MVDVDVCRFPASHAAGLRRLSSRASSTSTTRTAGLHSFNGLASSLVGRLRSMDVPLARGLSESELLRIESHLNFSFPPDLRALLSLALPSSPGFPRWRSDPLPSLSLLFSLPLLSLSSINRAARRSSSSSGGAPRLSAPPLLIPVFTRCYIPSRPSLAGNPVFYVDEDRIYCCALDLQDFISKISATASAGLTANSCPPSPVGCGNDGTGRTPRWIEFWSDAAASFDRRRRSSSSSSSSSDLGPDPERFVEIRPARVPCHGMGRYMEEIGMLLRNGGWGEEEVEEMVHLSEGCKLDCEEEEAVMDALVLRADRWKEELLAAGWEAGEVAEFLNMGNAYFEDALVGRRRRRRRRRRVVKLPPEIQFKVEKLAEEFVVG